MWVFPYAFCLIIYNLCSLAKTFSERDAVYKRLMFHQTRSKLLKKTFQVTCTSEMSYLLFDKRKTFMLYLDIFLYPRFDLGYS